MILSKRQGNSRLILKAKMITIGRVFLFYQKRIMKDEHIDYFKNTFIGVETILSSYLHFKGIHCLYWPQILYKYGDPEQLFHFQSETQLSFQAYSSTFVEKIRKVEELTKRSNRRRKDSKGSKEPIGWVPISPDHIVTF